MIKLSENFSLAEMEHTNHRVENRAGPREVEALEALCQNVLQPIRDHFGAPVHVSSGFRSAALNKIVGGSSKSQHCKGEAADISVQGVANVDVLEFIRDNLPFDQVIAELLDMRDGSAGWIHVSFSKFRQRKQVLSYLGGGRYVNGLEFAT